MAFQLASIFFFVVVGLSVPLVMLTLGWLVRPRTPTPEKLTVTSAARCRCSRPGSTSTRASTSWRSSSWCSTSRSRSPIRWPWSSAAGCSGAGRVAFVELGCSWPSWRSALAYVWRRGDLEWIRPRQEARAVTRLDSRRALLCHLSPSGRDRLRILDGRDPRSVLQGEGGSVARSGGVLRGERAAVRLSAEPDRGRLDQRGRASSSSITCGRTRAATAAW